MTKRILYIIVLYLLSFSSSWAQLKKVALHLNSTDSNILKGFNTALNYRDTIQFVNQINTRINRLHEEGYLMARVDRTEARDSTVHVFISPGERFNWASLKSGNVPDQILSKVGYREKIYTEQVFKIKQVNNLYKKIINLSQNSGYPFAAIKLDSIDIRKGSIVAALDYQPGPYITFDSLQLQSDIGIKRSWLAAYLGIMYDKAFDQIQVDNIEKKIAKLKFLKLVSPPQIIFQNERAIVQLNLKRKPSNSINGIIGFLPNEKEGGGTLITGQFDMGLTNLFNSGKTLAVHWQSLKPRSQLLKINYLHRNLFHSPLHFNASLYLLKEDTTFINRKGELAFHYQPSAHDLSFFTRFESSRLIGAARNPGELSDFDINYYGLAYDYAQITDTRVPRGISTHLEVAVGNKRIRNANTLPVDISDNLALKSTQYAVVSELQWLKPVSKIFGSYIRLRGGKIINDQLFVNDLFREGGLQSIRGFNENYFYASDYAIGTAEIRMYYEKGSFIFLFYDQSYLYYHIRANSYEDHPFGVGIGLSLKTKSGNLNLAYALGQSSEQPLSVSLSKFHFGYVANF